MDKFMQIAIEEARAAQAAGNYPYGSVLVRGGAIIGIGRNHMNTHNDPTSHAEMEVIRAAGLQAASVVRQGHIRTTVVDVAAKWHADLIVVGSHGRKGVKRILLGSVSDYVARHAPCSVQIVRMRAK